MQTFGFQLVPDQIAYLTNGAGTGVRSISSTAYPHDKIDLSMRSRGPPLYSSWRVQGKYQGVRDREDRVVACEALAQAVPVLPVATPISPAP